jgi:ABC-type nickel/cobalt efflux system permease component RcnA
MRTLGWRAAQVAGVIFLFTCAMAVASAQATHPFSGAGRPVVTSDGVLFSGLFTQVSYWQSQFYRQLADAVRTWKDEGGFGGLLIGLSFAYGVFHALGPGHGKAVIASYVVANRQTARNGAGLALVASLIQALVAIAVVMVLSIGLNVTAGVMNVATRWMEVAAYSTVMLLGVWLVWRKALMPAWRALKRRVRGRAQQHDHDHGHGLHDYAHHHDNCCGHAHIPNPTMVSGRLDLRRAWAALMAVGLRPCSGALIVLVFAWAQGFFFAGVVSALAMGLGTGLTVATLTVLSVWASHGAQRVSHVLSATWAVRVRLTIEALAAALVLLLGVLLLGGVLVR